MSTANRALDATDKADATAAASQGRDASAIALGHDDIVVPAIYDHAGVTVAAFDAARAVTLAGSILRAATARIQMA